MKKLIGSLIAVLVVLLGWKAYPFLPSSDRAIPALANHQTADLSAPTLNTKITLLRVNKSQRYLELFDGKTVVKRYPIRLGSNPIEHKTTEN